MANLFGLTFAGVAYVFMQQHGERACVTIIHDGTTLMEDGDGIIFPWDEQEVAVEGGMLTKEAKRILQLPCDKGINWQGGVGTSPDPLETDLDNAEVILDGVSYAVNRTVTRTQTFVRLELILTESKQMTRSGYRIEDP